MVKMVRHNSRILSNLTSHTKKSKNQTTETNSKIQTLPVVMIISGILLSLIFFTPSITGNTIKDITPGGASVVGGIFLALALIGAITWILNK